MSDARSDEDVANVESHGVDRCPVCFSTDLHSAELNGQAAVSCSDCDWCVTYAYLREQSRHE
jgi:hypothetical protein